MSEQSFNSIQDDEISLKEIIDFLIESWKAIAAVGVLGLLSALAFIFVTPSQYEATAQIKLAQIDSGNSTNPLGTNLEDQIALLARMKLPTAFSEKEVQVCKSSAEALANGVVRLTVVKGVTSLVELKIRGESREDAISCAQAIFEGIKNSQTDIMRPFIEEAKTLLLKYHVRMNDLQSLVARDDQGGQALSAVYLASRDELKFLSDEVIRLNAIIVSGSNRQTKLVSPIYVSNNPVYPKKKSTLVLGLLVGLFFGLLYVLARRVFLNYKLSSSL